MCLWLFRILSVIRDSKGLNLFTIIFKNSRRKIQLKFIIKYLIPESLMQDLNIKGRFYSYVDVIALHCFVTFY